MWWHWGNGRGEGGLHQPWDPWGVVNSGASGGRGREGGLLPYLAIFMEMSTAGTPCVRQPMLTTSTSGACFTKSATVLGMMPPLISMMMLGCFALISLAAFPTSLAPKLSSMMTSAPAAHASYASSTLRHSTSILVANPASLRVFCTVAVIPPQASMWLSLSMTMLDSEYLWVSTPATIRAYFSTSRKHPGVVLRVPATRPFQPTESVAFLASRATVATEDARVRHSRTVRSACNSRFTGPVATPSTTFSPFWTATSTPSSSFQSTVHPQNRRTASAKGTPARVSDFLA
mmetsp:Transcript_54691/g.97273  ORF Transcript_54691/g.97273 Transcript_54691/m.97273 type:complete len:289 (+) Transcript_54691:232-1098(+)